MIGRPNPSRVPVEVVFGGCHPDERTIDLCLEAAYSLSPHSKTIESCIVLVAERGADKEIRIDIRTAEGKVLVDRFTSATNEAQLRAALRKAFAQVARRMDDARDRNFELVTIPRPEQLEAMNYDAPPCVWYG